MSVLRIHLALRTAHCLTALVLMQSLANAQTPPASLPKTAVSAVQPAKAPAVAVAVATLSKPAWAELTAKQQESLNPLAGSWNGLNEAQKLKWLEVSKNYPNLPIADQAMMHSRMNEWATMSPQQRAAARLNFAKTKELSKELTPDEKKAKWQSYQALSPEEKAKLAAKATPKPAGAATAVKPVEQQKLAVTPKGMPPLPAVPPALPSTTRTGDTLQNVVTPAIAK